MFNLGPVFKALNSTFGRETTRTLIKLGTDFVAKENKKAEKTKEKGFEMIRKLKRSN